MITQNESGDQLEGQRVSQHAGDGEIKGPGDGVNADLKSIGCALPFSNPVQEKIIHSKVVRYMAGKYGIDQWCTEFLCGLDAYLDLTSRQDIGVAWKAFIDWTGARARWFKRMDEGGNQALEMGLIVRFPHGPGTCIDLSEKGRRLLSDYGRRFEEIRQELRVRSHQAAIKMMQKKAA